MNLNFASANSAYSAETRAGHARRFARLGSTGAACLAFFFAVLVCMAAAAAVASHDVPLILGGLR